MMTALRANQVRTRINRKGFRTFYLVAEDHNKEFHCLWFRSDAEAPMMVINPDAPYRPKETDIVVLDNLNLLTSTFMEILEEDVQQSPPVEEVPVAKGLEVKDIVEEKPDEGSMAATLAKLREDAHHELADLLESLAKAADAPLSFEEMMDVVHGVTK